MVVYDCLASKSKAAYMVVYKYFLCDEYSNVVAKAAQ